MTVDFVLRKFFGEQSTHMRKIKNHPNPFIGRVRVLGSFLDVDLFVIEIVGGVKNPYPLWWVL